MIMIEILYTSTAVTEDIDRDLKEILEISLSNNKHDEVTGILVHNESSYMQLLEGPEEKVEALFQRIQNDSRHTLVRVIWRHEISERSFDSWSMGYVNMAKVESKMLEGYEQYGGTNLNEIKKSEVESTGKSLLNILGKMLAMQEKEESS